MGASDRHVLLRRHVEDVQRPLLVAARLEELLGLGLAVVGSDVVGHDALARLEVEVEARRDRQREDPRLDPREVDPERLGASCGPPPVVGRALAGLELDRHHLDRVLDDVVVLEDVDAGVEVPVRQEVEVVAVGVERRVQAVVEVVGDRERPVLLEAVEEHLVVAVELDERVGDPLAVGRPGVVAHLPEELVVLHLVGRGELRQLLRRHVDVEEREVLVAEQDLRAVRRPLEVVDGAVEDRWSAPPTACRPRRRSRTAGSCPVLSEKNATSRAVRRQLRVALARAGRAGQVLGWPLVVGRARGRRRRAPRTPPSCRRSTPRTSG